jgi:hypothetical protein
MSLKDVIPERLLSGRPASLTMSALCAFNAKVQGMSKHAIECTASRMVARALFRNPRHSPIVVPAFVAVVTWPLGCAHAVAGTADMLAALVERGIQRAKGACALPLVVRKVGDDTSHLVCLLADPSASTLVYYDSNGSVDGGLLDALSSVLHGVSRHLGMQLRVPTALKAIQKVHAVGLCAWFSMFVATSAMLAWHRSGRPALSTVDALCTHADDPQLLTAFLKWAEETLRIAVAPWMRERQVARQPVNVRRCHDVHVIVDPHDARALSRHGRFRRPGALGSLLDDVKPAWALDESDVHIACWPLDAVGGDDSRGRCMMVFTWYESDVQLATVVAHAGRRQVMVRLSATGEHVTVPFHSVLWDKHAPQGLE